MFLLYGATGFVGDAIARLAVETGLRPVLAGRSATQVAAVATELGLEQRVFELGPGIDRYLEDVKLVLHCAGPYIQTYKPMVEAKLRASGFALGRARCSAAS